MRVHVVDPSAYTPPYDHALCRALAAAGAEVELFTSRFAYGAVAPAEGYRRRELFYRAARGAPALDGRADCAKLAEHVPDMLRYRRAARSADVVHFQWLPVQHLDGRLLPAAGVGGAQARADRARRAAARAAPRASARRSGACTSASTRSSCTPSTAASACVGELGVDPARVHVIPHGVFAHLARASRAGRERAGGLPFRPRSRSCCASG